MDAMKSPFSRLLVRFRRRSTQARAAKSLGVPVGTLRNWEQGRRNPGRITKQAIEEKIRAKIKSFNEGCNTP